MFSVAIYQTASSEIDRIISRMEFRQNHPYENIPERLPTLPRGQKIPSVQDLDNSRNKLLMALLIINGSIFVYAGGASYFLAGRTLRPIRIMVDEQNQFISSASHELRTPIATMRAEMEANLMEKHLSEKALRELIKSNLEELDTLQDLTNNLLRLAHVHNIKSDQPMDILDVKGIIEKAEKKVVQLAKQKHIAINSKLENITISGNKHDLIELFVILLDNAIKYSPEGTKITIISEVVSTGVKVTVKDEGQGIPAQDIPYIFERFYRADKSRSQADGYGLGLSIARKIVDTHNGTIHVTSVEKKGTTFIVTLPMSHS